MKKINLVLVLLNSFNLIAQSNNKRELGFTSDNDLYVSFFLDEYYTNGLELFYKEATTTKFRAFNKKIVNFTLSQKIYNPYTVDVSEVVNQDRPYAGYLYAVYSQQFINSKNILTLGIRAGLTGKKTAARELQNFIHQFYKIPQSNGWDTQVKQKTSLGVQLNYIYSLHHKPESKLQFSFTNNIIASSILSNISSGFALKCNLSRFKTTSIANTSFFGTALQTDDESWIKESYLGIKSWGTYQINDFTVKGELYNNPTHKQFNIEPWVWFNDIGYYLNLKRWNISYHQIFHTSNTKEINKKWIRYGSIQLSYKF